MLMDLLRNKVNKILKKNPNIPKRHKIAVLESLQNHAVLSGLFTSHRRVGGI